MTGIFAGYMFIFVVVLVIFVLLAILVWALYLLTLSRAMKEVNPKNRLVPPNNVWLMFIPVFNYIYGFILYAKISDSLSKEFMDRGITKNGDCARNLGITFAGLTLLDAILDYTPIKEYSGILSLVNLVIFIVWWVKISNFRNELKRIPKSDEFDISSNPDILD